MAVGRRILIGVLCFVGAAFAETGWGGTERAAAPSLPPDRIFLGSFPTTDRAGERFAFEWNDCIWIAAATGGVARAVTSGPGEASHPVLSPDGTRVAYVSNQDGDANHVFVTDLATGRVRTISRHSESTRPVAWTPDGSNLLAIVSRDAAGSHFRRIALLSAHGCGDARVLFDAEGDDPSLSPDGTRLLFRRRGDDVYRKRVFSKGNSEAGEIWLCDLEKKSFAPLVTGRLDARNPVWAPDGKGFYFLYAEGGVRNLYYQALGDAPSTSGKRRRLTDFVDEHVFQLAVSADGGTALFRQKFDFWRLDLRGGGVPAPIALRPFAGVGREPPTRRRWYDTAWNNDDPGGISFTSDGASVAFAAGGDLYVMEARSRTPRLVHGETLTHEGKPAFSPDGSVLYYRSSRGDGSAIWKATRGDPAKPWGENTSFVRERLVSDDDRRVAFTLSPDGGSFGWFGRDGALTFADTNGHVRARGPKSPRGLDYAWSPDGNDVVAAYRTTNLQYDVFIVSTRTNETAWALTRNYTYEARPAWSPDGKVIAWTSVRPDIADGNLLSYVFVCGTDGKGEGPKRPYETLRERVHVTKVRAHDPFFADDSRTVAFENGGKMWQVRLPDDLTPRKLFDHTGSPLRWTKKDADDRGEMRWSVGNVPAIDGRKLSFEVRQTTVLADYRELVFRSIWGLLRDTYYDPAMHGADWTAVRDELLPAARAATSWSVFNRVVRLLFGELDTSHLWYSESDSFRREWRHAGSVHAWKATTRHLGLRFDRAAAGAGWTVRDVIPDSPADLREDPIRPGDVVTAIDGTRLSAATPETDVLNGPSERAVDLEINGGRTVRLATISYDEARRLLRAAAVKRRRETVHAKSGGRLGYLDIPAMDNASLERFRIEAYEEGFGRDGLVIDVRGNGGGFTADRILQTLFAPYHTRWRVRGEPYDYNLGYSEIPVWHKGVTVLCGEETGSNAEIFSHAIQQLGRGKLVGRETGGNVIATDTVSILDYGTVKAPFLGAYLLDGRDMEYHGAVPDVPVDDRPEDEVNGFDRALDAAVRLSR